MKLLKGTARGGIEGNDIGLVFATTHRATAEHYAYRNATGEVVEFEVRDDLRIADLNDEATAQEIVNCLATFSDVVDEGAYIAELVAGESGDEIAIMDDDDFRRAVAECGYEGAMQDGHYALFAEAL
jgi:hypothetical protein